MGVSSLRGVIAISPTSKVSVSEKSLAYPYLRVIPCTAYISSEISSSKIYDQDPFSGISKSYWYVLVPVEIDRSNSAFAKPVPVRVIEVSSITGELNIGGRGRIIMVLSSV